ncbi:MAG TPA: hypothetical protein VIA98_05615 [Allosphingosinicella sp.]|jgi:hypothetical protein
MARVLRFLGLLCVVAAGLLFLSWGIFAIFTAVTFNNGGSLWAHPAIQGFIKVEGALAAAAALLLGLGALLSRRTN